MNVYSKQIEADFIFFVGNFQPIDWPGNNRIQDGCDHSTIKIDSKQFCCNIVRPYRKKSNLI